MVVVTVMVVVMVICSNDDHVCTGGWHRGGKSRYGQKDNYELFHTF